MYNLVRKQNCIYLKIVMHLVMQYTLSMFLHNIKHILNQERDIIIHVILNKTRQKKKKKMKIFNVFGFFF